MNESTALGYLGYCLTTTYLKVTPIKSVIQANIFRTVVNLLSMIVCILANFAVLKAYHDNRRLRNTSNFLLANLAVSDILVGCFGQPLYITRGILEIYAYHDCTFWDIEKISVMSLSTVSFGILFLISIERVIGTFLPFYYSTMCTRERAWPGVMFMWLGGFASVGILIYSRFIYYVLLALFIVIICSIFAIIYCAMWHTAREQRRKIHTSLDNKILKKNLKAETTIFWVVGSVLMCYLPMFIYVTWSMSHGVTVHSLYVVSTYVTTFVFVNSALNPIVYCWRSRGMREAAKKALTHCFRIRKQETSEHSN